MKFYLIGIKGSGMSALAHLLLDDGYQVEGSDVDKYIFTQERLINRKVKIHALSDKSYIKNCFVIVGHDFMDDFLINSFKKKNIPYLEYHKFLSFYINKKKLISVCGSHGKTTLVGLLSACDSKASFLRGDGYGRKIKNESFFFLESCEYRDHFLEYYPSLIVISNIDYDHVDYFRTEKDYISSFEKFSKRVSFGLINYEDYHKIKDPYYFTYGLDDKADFYVKDYLANEDGIKGKIYFQNQFITSFEFNNIYGIPLIKDVICVVAFYYLHHYPINQIIEGIRSFKMADRRFNINEYHNQVIIDDYAHHPNQMKVNLENVKSIYSNFLNVGIYKPDRASRLKYFNKEISDVLSKFDLSFIVDFNDKKNVDLIKNCTNEKVIYLENLNDIVKYIDKNKNYTFSLMSSKNLNEVKEIIKSHFK